MDRKIDLTAALEVAKDAALAAGKLQLAHLGKENLAIDTKSTDIDLVTEVDKKSEELILAHIRRHFPGHGVLAEESGRSAAQSEYVWVVDPLDGTTNYAQGLPIFAVSVALTCRGETVLGAVNCPVTGELFTAVRGQGAFLNDRKIHVANKTKLAQSVLATGFPYDVAIHPLNNLSYFNALIFKARAIRRLGAAAYDLACVAAGKFDGFWEMALSPWDVAAGALLVEEAGGTVILFRSDRGVSLIAGNPVLCEAIYREIQAVDAAR
ncbi:MAG: inositol monophosphatase [Negativicutes bacterium]|nr:inositol monophosphatase [Negativicutes bacterium]